MLKQKFIAVVALAATIFLSMQTSIFAFGGKTKKQASFKVRIENISSGDGLVAADGTRYPFAVSPGVYTLSDNKVVFFKDGKKASEALESQAEEGNPELLVKKFLPIVSSVGLNVFNKPVGADKPSPILPDGAFEFIFNATEGMKLNLVAMYGQSNDLFYAPAQAIELFDKDGNALTGDITGDFQLWDAGTEVNQAPGIGPDQAPRQKAPHTGARENGVVHLVKDGFSYPNTKDVLRVTITAQ